MEVLTYWEKKGRQEGKEELVVRQIQRRIGVLSSETAKRLEALNSDQLNDLGVALLDFTSKEDLENWLSGIKAQ